MALLAELDVSSRDAALLPFDRVRKILAGDRVEDECEGTFERDVIFENYLDVLEDLEECARTAECLTSDRADLWRLQLRGRRSVTMRLRPPSLSVHKEHVPLRAALNAYEQTLQAKRS
jgi:hypothetical protein